MNQFHTHFRALAICLPYAFIAVAIGNVATLSGQPLAAASVLPVTGILGDFDGDGKGDFEIVRPSEWTWYLRSNSTDGTVTTIQWGLPGDKAVPADYDRDRTTDVAVWRPSTGTWYIRNSLTGTVTIRQWGLPGDIPVPADYNGDGMADMAVWRPAAGAWFIRLSSCCLDPGLSSGMLIRQWGLPGDIPAPADYDGDGVDDTAVWRPSNGAWYVWQSSSGATFQQQWGLPGDIPLPGNYPKDTCCTFERGDLVVWRPSNGTWYVLQRFTSGGTFQWAVNYGLPGDVPLRLDFDGDHVIDFTVWRPTNGTWYVIPSTGFPSQSQPWFQQWGLPGDIPGPMM